ncbi:hypothetical protein AB0C51_10475 [Streptomyces pathocidini]|uniref:hypothetical protein n=1 Tax=Streptomyces pathocidini TaxID=1650571 RepID=UPI0033C0FBD8
MPTILLTSAVTAPGPAAAAPKASAAAFVLNADTGAFTTFKTAKSAASVQTVKTYNGAAADSQILTAGGQRVIADTTLASAPQREQRAAWAASSDFVDLSWPSVGAKTYTVYRDGIKIAQTSGHSFRDTNVTAGSEADYRIFGQAKGDGHTWGLNATIPAADDAATLAATAKGIEAEARTYTKTTVVWRSFIRQKWVKIPKALGKPSGCKYTTGYKYRGDNSGFSQKMKGKSFRAGVRGIINWNKSKYEYFPATGWTKVYKAKSGKFVDKRKASTKKIDFKAMNKHNGKNRAVRVTVQATDPFCPSSGVRAAGIGVAFNLQLTRTGNFYATGKYRQAPDHELNVYGHRGKKYTTEVIHRAKMASLMCLSQPACELGNISAKGQH